ncbi:hypothetical protein ACTSKR_11260 [Chitinibacteraceae bacterium HSL-7]
MDDIEVTKEHSTPQPGWESFYQLEARLRAAEERLASVERRLESGTNEFATIKSSVQQIHERQMLHGQTVEDVREILTELRGLVEAFGDLKGAIRLIKLGGDVLKWGLGLGAPAVAFYAAFKGFGL